MRMMKVILPAAFLVAGFVLCTTASYGKPEYSKKESKTCTFCHTKMGSKDLNDAGNYY